MIGNGIIFVYNLGLNWGDKKVICNKFEQNFPVTAMIWPNKKTSELFFGVADGKVKKAFLKNNTAYALYSTGSFVIAMSYNYSNTCLLSSHMDVVGDFSPVNLVEENGDRDHDKNCGLKEYLPQYQKPCNLL